MAKRSAIRRWQVIAIAISLVAVSCIGFLAQAVLNDFVQSGISGMSAGRGNDALVQALRTEHGAHVRYEVYSVDGRPLDVYLTDLDGCMAAMQNLSFEYIESGSAMNVTHFAAQLELDSSKEVYDVVVMSSDPSALVPSSITYEQFQFPLDYSLLLRALYFICWIASIALFFLLIHSLTERTRTRRS